MKCCLWYIDALMATFEVWVGYRNMCHDWLNAFMLQVEDLYGYVAV